MIIVYNQFELPIFRLNLIYNCLLRIKMNITDTRVSERNLPTIDPSKSSHSKRHQSSSQLGELETITLKDAIFNGSL